MHQAFYRCVQLKSTPDAPAVARTELEKLGPMSRTEKLTALALGVTVVLWVGGGAYGISSVAAATIGLAMMLFTNVITWKDCLNESTSWDSLTWFAALIALGGNLNKYGLIPWMSR